MSETQLGDVKNQINLMRTSASGKKLEFLQIRVFCYVVKVGSQPTFIVGFSVKICCNKIKIIKRSQRNENQGIKSGNTSQKR